MKLQTALIIYCLLAIAFSGCSPRGKFLRSSEYQKAQPVEKIYVTVIASKDTKACFDYLEDFLKDSLIKHGLSVDSKYYCCRDKKTDVKQVINDMIPPGTDADHILTVMITKDVVGYGTTSSREVAIDLLDTKTSIISWSGKLSVDFEWFISDEDYRNVASKINKLIINELVKKEII